MGHNPFTEGYISATQATTAIEMTPDSSGYHRLQSCDKGFKDNPSATMRHNPNTEGYVSATHAKTSVEINPNPSGYHRIQSCDVGFKSIPSTFQADESNEDSSGYHSIQGLQSGDNSSGMGYLYPTSKIQRIQSNNKPEEVGYITPSPTGSKSSLRGSSSGYHRIYAEELGNDKKIGDSIQMGYISIGQVGASGTPDTNSGGEGYISVPQMMSQH